MVLRGPRDALRGATRTAGTTRASEARFAHIMSARLVFNHRRGLLCHTAMGCHSTFARPLFLFLFAEQAFYQAFGIFGGGVSQATLYRTRYIGHENRI